MSQGSRRRLASSAAVLLALTLVPSSIGDQTDSFGYSCELEDAAFEEATSVLVVTQYRKIAAGGREQGNSATIGIENAAGTVALQVSSNEAVLGVQPAVTSVRFTPPS